MHWVTYLVATGAFWLWSRTGVELAVRRVRPSGWFPAAVGIVAVGDDCVLKTRLSVSSLFE